MTARLLLVIGLVAAVLVLGSVALGAAAQGPKPRGAQAALGTGFSYQGQLKSSGAPVNGTCEIAFRLYNAPVNGNVIGMAMTPTIAISNGLFTTLLDFGTDAFNGDARWLDMQVSCPAGGGIFTPLSRQQLTATPYALYSAGNWGLNGNTGTNSNTNFVGTTDNVALTIGVNGTAALRILPDPAGPAIVGGYSGNGVGGAFNGATIGGGGSPSFGSNVISGTNVSYSTIAGGVNNLIAGNAYNASIGGGYSNVISGTDAGRTVVGGGLGNAAEGYVDTIGGGEGNSVTNTYSTVSGGRGNRASGYASTISGGDSNTASDDYSTVGGGTNNTASFYYGTVGGGQHNTASNPASTVGGGKNNRASNQYSTASGGISNTASGLYSTVPGGFGNVAGGQTSFAAGYSARALHDGAFVWADSTGNAISSTAANQFIVRASGGIGLFTNSTASAGATLAPGSGSWSIVSDRSAKMNFSSVDGREVLARLASIPVETWSYKTQDASIRHMGPMAQDFYAAFGVGENDTTISTVDAQGVALAAIQGLIRVVQEQDGRIAQLESAQHTQQQQIADLQTRLSAPARTPTASSAAPSALSVEWLAIGALVLMNGLLLTVGAVCLRRGRVLDDDSQVVVCGCRPSQAGQFRIAMLAVYTRAETPGHHDTRHAAGS